MKKLVVMIISMLVLLTSLTACTQNAKSVENTSTPSQSNILKTVSPTATQKSSPAPIQISINSNKLTFDESINKYFGGDVESALVKIEPMLTSASFAQYSYKTPFVSTGESLDPTFSWYTLFWLLNTGDYPGSKVVRNSDGSFTLTAEKTKEVFESVFANFSGTIPSIPDDFKEIISKDKNGNYLISVANSETMLYRLKGITLSKANSATDPTQSATLAIDVMDIDQKVLMTVEIEVIKNDDSAFGYSIQSVDIAED